MRREIALFCLVASTAVAAEPNAREVILPGGERAVLSEVLCSALAQQPDPAEAAYKPGVDVAGRPVAPADIGGGGLMLSGSTPPVEISIDLQQRAGVPASVLGISPLARLGYVTVENGRAYLNGQALTDETQADLATACRGRR